MSPESARDKLVTIIVPCYNQARYLSECVSSIQGQTHANWECIVVNDGSTDNTQEVAEELARSEPRLRCIRQANGGLSAARNTGLDAAKGQYVQFLDADDTIDKEKFELQLAAIPDIAELVVSYTDYVCYSESPGIEVPAGYRDPDLDVANPFMDIAKRFGSTLGIPVHSFLFDSRFFTEHGLRFDTELVSCEDFACWLRVFGLDPIVVRVDAKLATYRWHASSMSQNKERMLSGYRLALKKAIVEFRDNREVAEALAARLGLPMTYVTGQMSALGKAKVRCRLAASAIACRLLPAGARRAIKRCLSPGTR